MKEIVFKNLCKSYDGKTNVLEGIDLTVQPGERLILLGPSGCGKSTMLRIIAGLEEINSGTLIMNEREVNHVKSGERNVAMVFQNYALYPHMTVWQNLSYALKVNGLSADEIEKRNRAAIDMLQLQGLEERRPKDLSGGQRQRVALARAVVKHQDYLLLDEPLSNLDAQLRARARQELVRLHEKFGMTLVYVTHDQIEAMTVGDRIVVMNQGKIQMAGTPEEVYHNPKNIFTARFIGAPPMNILKANYKKGELRLEGRDRALIVPTSLQAVLGTTDRALFLGIRPERLQIKEEPAENTIPAGIQYLEDYGSTVSMTLVFGDQTLMLTTRDHSYQKGQRVHVAFPPEHLKLFDRETEENIIYGLA